MNPELLSVIREVAITAAVAILPVVVPLITTQVLRWVKSKTTAQDKQSLDEAVVRGIELAIYKLKEEGVPHTKAEILAFVKSYLTTTLPETLKRQKIGEPALAIAVESRMIQRGLPPDPFNGATR